MKFGIYIHFNRQNRAHNLFLFVKSPMYINNLYIQMKVLLPLRPERMFLIQKKTDLFNSLVHARRDYNPGNK